MHWAWRSDSSGGGSSFNAVNVETLNFNNLNDYVLEYRYSVDRPSLNNGGWSLANEQTQRLLEKLDSLSIPLGKYVNGEIYRGVLTGLNDAFVIDEKTRERLISEDSKSAELIKPFLIGKNIKRYETPESDQHLILIPNGWTRNKFSGSNVVWTDFRKNYPAIANYLSPFAESAEKRYDKGEFWWELRACDYYGEFEKPKIFWPEIAQSARFTLDSSNFYANNKTYIIPTEDFFLLGLLNSSSLRMFIHSVCTDLQGNSFNFSAVFVERTPIRRISFTTPAPERARLGAELEQLYAEGKHAEILALVEACLPKDAAGNFIAEPGKIGCGARPAGLPGGENAGDEQAEAEGDQGLPGLAGGLRGGKGGGPHTQDQSCKATTSTITRASWRC